MAITPEELAQSIEALKAQVAAVEKTLTAKLAEVSKSLEQLSRKGSQEVLQELVEIKAILISSEAEIGGLSRANRILGFPGKERT